MQSEDAYVSKVIDITIGAFNINEEGVIIVDRESEDEITRLYINDTIKLIKN
jgi:hypothetical protein